MTAKVVYSLFRRRINFINMKRILPFFIVLSVVVAQIDFNEGPYGSEYFDITGPFTVDNAHVVAWEPTLDYKIAGMGNLKSTFLSGEGLVMKFNGHGKLYLQTRTVPSLVDRLTPLLRP